MSDSKYLEHQSFNKKLIKKLNRKNLPNLKQFKYLGKFLSPKDSWLMIVGGLLALAGLFILSSQLYHRHFQSLPAAGGSYIEGTVGKPRLINPLYASLSGVDADLSKLLYSSLFKRDKNGSLSKDLVESYKLEPDQKTYVFTLIRGARWHNGGELTSADVLFTLDKLQDPAYKSPLRTSFLGVVAKPIDDYSFSLTLPEAYAPFPELLTFGILPKSLWEETSANSAWLNELNLKPIGTGPYKFNSLTRDQAGNIHSYSLAANPDYYGQKPYLNKLTVNFYPTPEELINAINGGDVDGASYLTADYLNAITAKNSYNINFLKIPENTALIFNLRDKASPLADPKVRQALALSLNKDAIVKEVFGEAAGILNGPINPASFGYSEDVVSYNFNRDEAKKLLADSGFAFASTTEGQFLAKKGVVLSIKLTVPDVVESIRLAESVSAAWQELGIKTDLEIVDPNNLSSAVLKPKNFQALLNTWVAGLDPDPYYTWHSSQSGENGLNLSGYANTKIDKLLEEARLTADLNKRKANYAEFQKSLTADAPAVFLYSPRYIYLQNKKVKGFDVSVITSPEDRFDNILNWYVKETKSLKF